MLGSNIHVGNMSTLGGVLPPFTASDNFSGVYPNSGAVGDASWDRRWTAVTTNGSVSIVAGALNSITLTTGGFTPTKITSNLASLSGDFTFSGDIVWNSAQPNLSNSHNCRIYLDDTNNTSLWLGRRGPNSSWEYDYSIWSNGVNTVPSADIGAQPTSFEISRSGTTITYKINGSTVRTETNSNTFTNIHFDNIVANASNNMDIDLDNISLVDGNGAPILI